MTKNRVQVSKVLYKDKTYYHITCDNRKLLVEYYNYVRPIGDEIYMIDNELYVDEFAYTNISLYDAESIFIIQ